MSPKLTELINAYYNAVSVNVAEARAALDTEISRIEAELEFCDRLARKTTEACDGDEVMSKSALQLILDIAEGSATVNSFPHIAKVARKALDEASADYIAGYEKAREDAAEIARKTWVPGTEHLIRALPTPKDKP